MSIDHYENFPVASLLCPPAMRAGVQALYHFARTADDLADEGDAPADVRRVQLQQYRQHLVATAKGQAPHGPWAPVFGPLAQAIAHHKLPLPLLTDLLDAFTQDTHNPRYADRSQLLDYCSRSANPVGRLMLHMAGVHDAQALAQSDAICSALQLINFWQDTSVDLPRGRHYVPVADAHHHGLTLDQLAHHQASGANTGSAGLADTPASQALLRDLCHWAAALMAEGAPLACRVPGRLGWELRLVVQGGLRILERISAMDYRTLCHRPTVGPADLPVLLWRALRMRPARPTPGFGLR